LDFYRSEEQFAYPLQKKKNIAEGVTSGSEFLTCSVLGAAQICDSSSSQGKVKRAFTAQ